MKKLTQFLTFDKRFYEGKAFVVVDTKTYSEYSADGTATDNKLGTKIDALVIQDDTKYPKQEDKGINKYQKLSFKLPNVFSVNVKQDDLFTIDTNEIIKASVYGNYRNELSTTIRPSAIKVVNASTKG